jgi:formate dehydrogenase (coenzyme F420) beta subunit
MADITQAIRDIARQLLDDRVVDVVVGYEQGTVPLRASPCFIRDPHEVDRLVWNAYCETNLARYLRGSSEKVAVVAKGCDAESITSLIAQKQVDRERLTIIGVPCRGMLDRRRIAIHTAGREVLETKEDGETLHLLGCGFDLPVAAADFLFPACQECARRSPLLFDILAGAATPQAEPPERHRKIREFEAMDEGARWQAFSAEIAPCIRCYACRNACPNCFCDTCFAERSNPQWIGRTDDPSDTAIFHIMRAFHSAGRCSDCGACERACPMGIRLRFLAEKVEMIIAEQFGGGDLSDPERPLPLAVFSPDDPQAFIR